MFVNRSKMAVLIKSVALGTVLAATLAGCQNGGLTSSSTCSDYIKASAQEEMQLVQDLYHQAHAAEPAAGMGAANAVMNVSYECGQSPSQKVGDLGDFH